MKRKLFILLLMISSMQLKAQYQDLWVNVIGEPSTLLTFQFKGFFKNRPYWTAGTNHLAFYGNKWNISSYTSDTTFFERFGGTDYSDSIDLKYPTKGWTRFEVEIVRASLKYSTKFLPESENNDGSFSKSITIKHNQFNKQTFSGSMNEDFLENKFASAIGLPADFSPKLIKTSDSTLTFYIAGSTLNHIRGVNDTSFILKFSDNAFSNGGSSDSTNNSIMKIALRFRNKITVDKNSTVFNTIQKALDSAGNLDIIYIKKGIYTESELKNTSNLRDFILHGESPHNTIIQADSSPYKAQNKRVFNINNYESVEFKNLTIQHGYFSSGTLNTDGVGIYLSPKTKTSTAILSNCRVTKNACRTSSKQYGYGGGIHCKGKIKLINCEVSENEMVNADTVINTNKRGGGIYSHYGVELSNSTVSKNKTTGTGGGILTLPNGFSEINNSTITQNIALNSGGGIHNYDKILLINSIVHNNLSNKQNDILCQNPVVNKITIFNSFVKDTSQHSYSYKYFIGNPSIENPLLDTLNFNCSYVRTHALLPGSPAINSAYDTSITSSIDQRGYSKVGKRDIGAHEFAGAIEFSLTQDTLCIEDKLIIDLTAQPHVGAFSGKYISNNQLDLSSVTEEGYVYVNYNFNLPGCENSTITDSIFVKMCKQNSTKNFQLPVTFYPNPAQNELFIQNAMGTNMNLVIYSITGNKVADFTQLEARAQVNINHLNSGIYFATIESNGLQTTVKFIKQ